MVMCWCHIKVFNIRGHHLGIHHHDYNILPIMLACTGGGGYSYRYIAFPLHTSTIQNFSHFYRRGNPPSNSYFALLVPSCMFIIIFFIQKPDLPSFMDDDISVESVPNELHEPSNKVNQA